MTEVHVEGDEPSGLAQMVAGLIEANAATDPVRARLLATTRGVAEIEVPDAGVTVGLKFVPGALTVTSSRVQGANVRIVTDSDTLLALSSVPLRLGLPDPLSSAGRDVAWKLVTRRLKIRGLPFGITLLRTVNRLLSVS